MENARRLNLSPTIIEKDYVLNWILAGIDNDKELNQSWVFKGGTCLKKCFFEEYRFSEDLDFTVIDAAQINDEFLRARFKAIADWVYDESGIELPEMHRRFEVFRNPRGVLSVEGRVGYRGPMQQRRGQLSRIKIDLTSDEILVFDAERRDVYHPYSDLRHEAIRINAYCFEEIFAEKLRALAQRLRPRDLYDVVHLHEDNRWQPNREMFLRSLKKKCEYKKIDLPQMAALSKRPEYSEIVSEWDNMLAHQISGLQPFEYYWDKLPEVLAWIR